MRIGFVINPLAGIGGAVALKGSDGSQVVAQAFERGASLQAETRATVAISMLDALHNCQFYTASGAMGENVLQKAGLPSNVVYTVAENSWSAADTKETVLQLIKNKVDLLVFAGGDGTARDVLDAINASTDIDDVAIPVVGIPAGVKIHSAVYAVTPTQAGELINLIASGEAMSLVEAQVMDLDEDAFRAGSVKAKCYGYLTVPVDDTRMQLIKQGGINHNEIAVQEIAGEVIDDMQQDIYYLIGSGSTTAEIMQQLSLKNTLLGVDIICNQQLVASDVDEKKILEIIKSQPAKIVVTIIGGQGHLFGRGNQQLSSTVIQQVGKDNIIIMATNEKLRSLDKRPIIADTGDVKLDKQLAGLYSVITGYQQKTLYKLT